MTERIEHNTHFLHVYHSVVASVGCKIHYGWRAMLKQGDINWVPPKDIQKDYLGHPKQDSFPEWDYYSGKYSMLRVPRDLASLVPGDIIFNHVPEKPNMSRIMVLKKRRSLLKWMFGDFTFEVITKGLETWVYHDEKHLHPHPRHLSVDGLYPTEQSEVFLLTRRR
jgi:hypothetical protein